MEYTYMEYKKMQNIQTIIFIMVLKKKSEINFKHFDTKIHN